MTYLAFDAVEELDKKEALVDLEEDEEEEDLSLEPPPAPDFWNDLNIANELNVFRVFGSR